MLVDEKVSTSNREESLDELLAGININDLRGDDPDWVNQILDGVEPFEFEPEEVL